PRWGAGGMPGSMSGGPSVNRGEIVSNDEQTTLDWEAGETVFPPPGLFPPHRTFISPWPDEAAPAGGADYSPPEGDPAAPGGIPGAGPERPGGVFTGGVAAQPGGILAAGPGSFAPSGTPAPRPREIANVWQVQNKYILSQIKSGLVVIDQHVAHERILYERAKKNISQADGASQQLLFPQTLELSPQDYQVMVEISPWLEKLGFQIKLFGGRTIVVEGVPTGMRVGAENRLLLNIIDQYKEYAATESDMRERVAKSFACRSAIMAGEKLSVEAMNALIDQLFATENPYFCPHGRPVMITITVDELDRRFDRK
ncbi:MAG TPA: hypothetical protein PLG50_12985, partial [bacterium]|nr:hypothetical protein [bacterium]